MMETNIPIAIDVTDASECAVAKEMFSIKHYSFLKDHPFDDLVTNSAPYFHFQILKPKDEVQREKSIQYFNDNHKLFVAWSDRQDLLLYIGATQMPYIRSSTVKDIDEEQLKNVVGMAAHWYRFYGATES